MDANNMSFDEIKKKKTELFKSYKYPIIIRLPLFCLNGMVCSKFKNEYHGYFFLNSSGVSKLSLTNLIKLFGENLEKYRTTIISKGYYIKRENHISDANTPYLVVEERIQLNKRIFYVNFCIEDDTDNPYPENFFGTLGADFLIQNKAIIDYESKRLWVDDYKKTII